MFRNVGITVLTEFHLKRTRTSILLILMEVEQRNEKRKVIEQDEPISGRVGQKTAPSSGF
jgi:hypothetical protein